MRISKALFNKYGQKMYDVLYHEIGHRDTEKVVLWFLDSTSNKIETSLVSDETPSHSDWLGDKSGSVGSFKGRFDPKTKQVSLFTVKPDIVSLEDYNRKIEEVKSLLKATFGADTQIYVYIMNEQGQFLNGNLE